MRRSASPYLIAVVLAACVVASRYAAADPDGAFTEKTRLDAIHRAQVWTKTNVPAMDVKAGPQGEFAFPAGETVTCDFVNRPRGSGSTLKFGCLMGPDRELKVRYGDSNGEIYAQVAATRLLWALGFAASRMYPVRVACRGCTSNPWEQTTPTAERNVVVFDPATIDVKLPGRTLELKPDGGWSWKELDLVEEAAGGALTAHRDALKLLAVLIQHSSNKRPNQRLLCLDAESSPEGVCAHPMMMIVDLGKTFGRATAFNSDETSSVNFKEWSRMKIWTTSTSECIGNLPGSFTGTLSHPQISEAGRKFLADLLAQLTDAQLHDLFDVARFTRRDAEASVDDWVGAFKQKRAEIVNRTCSVAVE